ncbi:MAG: cysteine dioxygenase [Actinomycetia bacterium]|nr:cysteine dioxygenase [Actinomycetes bacterium]
MLTDVLTDAVDGRAIRALSLASELLCDRGALLVRARTLTFVPGERAWTRVLDTPDADAWLIAWDGSSRVGAHDHGGSHGAVHVLQGTLTESYRPNPKEATERVRHITRGTTLTIPEDHVHDVANLGRRRALSLHVYSPRLTSMTFYPPVPG